MVNNIAIQYNKTFILTLILQRSLQMLSESSGHRESDVPGLDPKAGKADTKEYDYNRTR